MPFVRRLGDELGRSPQSPQEALERPVRSGRVAADRGVEAAVGEPVGRAVRQVQRECRLADPAVPGQNEHRGGAAAPGTRADHTQHATDRGLAAREVTDARREHRGSRRGRRGRRRALQQRGVAAQDRGLQRAQRLGGFDAELGDRHVTGTPVLPQRVGLPAGSEQRQHELAAHLLAQRVVEDLAAEQRYQLRVPAVRQHQRGQLLDHDGAALLQGHCPVADGGTGDLREDDGPPPQREGTAQDGDRLTGSAGPYELAGAVDGALELQPVQLRRAGFEGVAGASGHDPGHGGPQPLPEVRDADLDLAPGRRRRSVRPHRVDQPFGRDRRGTVEQQTGEDDLQPRPSRVHGLTRHALDVQHAENPQSHGRPPWPLPRYAVKALPTVEMLFEEVHERVAHSGRNGSYASSVQPSVALVSRRTAVSDRPDGGASR